MVYVDWQERLKTKAELLAIKIGMQVLISPCEGIDKTEDFKIETLLTSDVEVAPFAEKQMSRDMLHHFVDTADTCRLLLGLAMAYQQMSFAFRSMDA